MTTRSSAPVTTRTHRRCWRPVGAVFVPRGTWRYRDPGRIVAERVGATAPRSVIAELGVLQQTLFTRACLAIRDGELDVALVVRGRGEVPRPPRPHHRCRARRHRQDDDVAPDESLRPADEIIPAPETRRRV